MMIHQLGRPGLRLLLLLSLALVVHASAHAQQTLAFAGCVSRDSVASRVLAAPAALNTSIHPELQNFNTCLGFCRERRIPPRDPYRHAEVRGDLTSFAAPARPYTYVAFSRGGWCICCDQINAQLISLDYCRQQIACLQNPGVKCEHGEADQMIFTLGSGGGGGGVAGGQPPPTPKGANRTPYAPVVDPGGWEPPFPLRYEGAIQLTWQDNGDPDGDPLNFGVLIWYYDEAQQTWFQLPTLRDFMGVFGRVWVTEPYYTFTTQAGLRPNTQYAWSVLACDLARGAEALCSTSQWSRFRTVP